MLTRDEINSAIVPFEASSLIAALPVDLSLKAQCCFASLHLIEMVSRGGFVCVTCFLGTTLFVCFLYTDACDLSLFPQVFSSLGVVIPKYFCLSPCQWAFRMFPSFCSFSVALSGLLVVPLGCV